MVRLAAALLCSIALATACGSDSESDSNANDTTAATSEETEPPDVTDPAAPTDAPTTAAQPTTTALEPVDPGDPGARNCHVDIVGAVSASFDSPQQEGYFQYSEPRAFFLSCIDGDVVVSFSNWGGEIPREPAEYTLSGKQPLLGGVDGFPMTVDLEIAAITSLQSSYKIQEDGFLSITRFDDELIEGTFMVPAGRLMADSADTFVTGAFSYEVADS